MKKGTVKIAVGGSEYQMRLSINEIADLEETLDKSANEIALMLGDGANLRVGFIRTVFHAALKGGGHDLSLEQVGELIAEMDAANAMDNLGKTFNASFPEPEGDDSPPVMGQDGTGKAS